MLNDPERARQMLAALNATGARWAMLHGADQLASDALDSDLDVLVDSAPAAVTRRLVETAPSDLMLTMMWRYDAASLTTFWLSQDARAVVQLDLTHDPHGRGKYGIRTGSLLSRRRQADAIWRTSKQDETLYLLSKRLYKGQVGRANELVARLPRDSSDRIHEVFSSRTAAAIRTYLADGRYRRPVRFFDATRYADRLCRPVGHVLEIEADEVDRVVERLEGAFPHLMVLVEPSRLEQFRATRTPTLALVPRHQSNPATCEPARATGDIEAEDAIVQLVKRMQRAAHRRLGLE